ncbi:glycosyltransferase [Belliella sp. R4-6]|uniref:Glycosyltransferase n=1 Tax=Belliella alkalica TaxID=1730871 RepID=A0ABS9V7J4_9BACT|nr:glycosyltransferase [Belliella alkalica]MCH7412392.1 glycosyltransferase [Belliella alkalica]
MKRNRFFAGFIITYNRSKILLETIEKVFSQSLPPEKLWVIDNSEDKETKDLIATLVDFPLEYFQIGYNSGPAHAAKIGLQLVSEAGYDWIYWGDDNDPPFRSDCFERLLSRRNSVTNVGVLGAVGQYFDFKNGVVNRVRTIQLEKSTVLNVDFVAGGMCMLVNSNVVNQNILPESKLFFGFEELDFCLKVKNSGWEIMVDSALFLEARKASNRLNFERPLYQRKANLAREYYSLRNLLMISSSFHFKEMRRNLYLRWIAKSFYGFRFGLTYGWRNFKVIWLAFFHYWKGVSGKTIALN